MRKIYVYVSTNQRISMPEDAEVYQVETEDDVDMLLLSNLFEDIDSLLFVGNKTSNVQQLAESYNGTFLLL